MKNAHLPLFLLPVLILPASCKPKNQSQVKVLNGRKIIEETPETLPVVMLYSNKTGTTCTGTLINASTILTAAHCFSNLDNPTDSMTIPSVALPRRVYIHDQYPAALAQLQKLDARPNAATDTALILENTKFFLEQYLPVDIAIVAVNPEDTKSTRNLKKYYRISTDKNAVKVGKSVYIVGFGADRYLDKTFKPDLNTVGVKREGIAKIKSIQSAYASISGLESYTYTDESASQAQPGTPATGGTIGPDGFPQDAPAPAITPGYEVSIAPGDSGGPWIRCVTSPREGRCSSFEIVAISQSAQGITGNGTLLATDIVQSFLTKTFNEMAMNPPKP